MCFQRKKCIDYAPKSHMGENIYRDVDLLSFLAANELHNTGLKIATGAQQKSPPSPPGWELTFLFRKGRRPLTPTRGPGARARARARALSTRASSMISQSFQHLPCKTWFFELFLHFSRSQSPPVFEPDHLLIFYFWTRTFQLIFDFWTFKFQLRFHFWPLTFSRKSWHLSVASSAVSFENLRTSSQIFRSDRFFISWWPGSETGWPWIARLIRTVSVPSTSKKVRIPPHQILNLNL